MFLSLLKAYLLILQLFFIANLFFSNHILLGDLATLQTYSSY